MNQKFDIFLRSESILKVSFLANSEGAEGTFEIRRGVAGGQCFEYEMQRILSRWKYELAAAQGNNQLEIEAHMKTTLNDQYRLGYCCGEADTPL